jgi:hypothetical protein
LKEKAIVSDQVSKPLDLCISALHAMKVSRETYASGPQHQQIKSAIADALALNDAPLCKGIAEVIRSHG